jgi:DNA-binding CsgD family transcriptional regulator
MRPHRSQRHDFAPLPTHCPVTGMPVQGHPSWRYNSPGGRYRLRVSVLGDRIIWLQPQGYLHLEDARRGKALLDDVLFAVLPRRAAFIALDDYSAVDGASLNARRFIFNILRNDRRHGAYIVYGASRPLGLGLTLGRRLGLFPQEVVVVPDYAAAAAAALRQLLRLESDGEVPAGGREERSPSGLTADGEGGPGLAAYAEHLLAFVGAIAVEPYGLRQRVRSVAIDHPWRPVYDALSVLRDDRRAILDRHREARLKLEARQRALTESQVLLQETHTTLNILLAARQERRQRLERRVKDGMLTLLKPLMDDLDRRPATGRAPELRMLLRQVIDHIGSALPSESQPPTVSFTARERLIAFLLTAGWTVQDAARLLGLSRRSVENHCQRMRGKLGLQGRRPTLREWLAPESPRAAR